MSAEHARGRLEALRRIAEEGAAKGWHTVPALAAVLARIVRVDHPNADPDRPPDPFLAGWAVAVIDVAEQIATAGTTGLAAFLQAAVLDAELMAVA